MARQNRLSPHDRQLLREFEAEMELLERQQAHALDRQAELDARPDSMLKVRFMDRLRADLADMQRQMWLLAANIEALRGEAGTDAR